MKWGLCPQTPGIIAYLRSQVLAKTKPAKNKLNAGPGFAPEAALRSLPSDLILRSGQTNNSNFINRREEFTQKYGQAHQC